MLFQFLTSFCYFLSAAGFEGQLLTLEEGSYTRLNTKMNFVN